MRRKWKIIGNWKFVVPTHSAKGAEWMGHPAAWQPMGTLSELGRI
jgi:hypothetical protein